MDRVNAAIADVECLLANGSSFGVIEDYIERRGDLTPQSRSALWLFAFTETEREERRRTVREMIEQAESGLFGVLPARGSTVSATAA